MLTFYVTDLVALVLYINIHYPIAKWVAYVVSTESDLQFATAQVL